ncbi:MAG TPA: hypothetical protein VKG25_28740 [Bryobacteraceae bacterium]|nr:hypothetical protein [Bryobacteraceae bacterium]
MWEKAGDRLVSRWVESEVVVARRYVQGTRKSAGAKVILTRPSSSLRVPEDSG